jgi:hypothetical protein
MMCACVRACVPVRACVRACVRVRVCACVRAVLLSHQVMFGFFLRSKQEPKKGPQEKTYIT